jgi:hypothetical protein
MRKRDNVIRKLHLKPEKKNSCDKYATLIDADFNTLAAIHEPRSRQTKII